VQDTHPVILGLDFLKQNKASVDFDTSVLKLEGIEYKLVSPSKKSTLATVKSTISLPPGMTTVVPLRLRKHPKSCTLTLEPTSLFQEQFPDLEIIPLVFDSSAQPVWQTIQVLLLPYPTTKLLAWHTEFN